MNRSGRYLSPYIWRPPTLAFWTIRQPSAKSELRKLFYTWSGDGLNGCVSISTTFGRRSAKV